MKKFMFLLCLLTASVAAQAQFEQGKWLFNPSVTGLGLSHSELEGTRFGFEVLGGSFVVDNAALLVNLGAEWTDGADMYTAGVGGRYYLESIGIYLGTSFKLKRYNADGGHDFTDFAISPEVGYAFFVGRNITIEPAVYYDISFKDGDYSKLGLKVGFGIYF